jgi:hypothetical protein
VAETATMTTYVGGKKRRHPASYRKPPARTVFKKSKSTTGGTKHSGSIKTSSGGM